MPSNAEEVSRRSGTAASAAVSDSVCARLALPHLLRAACAVELLGQRHTRLQFALLLVGGSLGVLKGWFLQVQVVFRPRPRAVDSGDGCQRKGSSPSGRPSVAGSRSCSSLVSHARSEEHTSELQSRLHL